MRKIEYPKNLREFRQKFLNDIACLEYLSEKRWPEGFVCPRCLSKFAWLNTKRYIYECQDCRKQTSPTAGTLMHRSHVPIQEWFWAAYLVATHTPGISALQLQRQLGIAKYDTAWYLLHRLRKGMVDDCRTKLSGLIEADETIIGGPAKGKKGRGVTVAHNKSLVIGAVEVRSYTNKQGKTQERAGRVRLEVISHANETLIKSFMLQNVEKGSNIRTDGWRGYSKTALADYKHMPLVLGSPQNAHQLAPHIHRVFSNLKTWLNGTHHSVDPKYLQSYLNEYVFRFNRRIIPMAAFQTLLKISSQKNPAPLRQIKQPESNG